MYLVSVWKQRRTMSKSLKFSLYRELQLLPKIIMYVSQKVFSLLKENHISVACQWWKEVKEEGEFIISVLWIYYDQLCVCVHACFMFMSMFVFEFVFLFVLVLSPCPCPCPCLCLCFCENSCDRLSLLQLCLLCFRPTHRQMVLEVQMLFSTLVWVWWPWASPSPS